MFIALPYRAISKFRWPAAEEDVKIARYSAVVDSILIA
jgi:hypothetical protein